MLLPVPQQAASFNFSGLTWTLDGENLLIQGVAKTPSGPIEVDEAFDLSTQAPGSLFLAEAGPTFAPEGALAHLGHWDGTDFSFIDHNAT